MTIQSLYRPTNLDEFRGSEALVRSLQSVMDRDAGDVPPAFLFAGPSGCGKTTLAKILKNMLEISDMDYHFYNASNTRGIETIREIIENAPYFGLTGGKKLYVFEECHMLTGPAQESMLHLLEEPPAHAHFVLCTTNPQKLKITLRRRCFIGTVEPLSTTAMGNLLHEVLEEEEVSLSQKVLDKIMSVSDGSPGIALGHLDSVIDMDDDELAILAIAQGVPDARAFELCQALMHRPVPRWNKVQPILKSIKDIDAESVRMLIVSYFTTVMLGKTDQTNADIALLFTDSFINSKQLGLILACWEACNL